MLRYSICTRRGCAALVLELRHCGERKCKVRTTNHGEENSPGWGTSSICFQPLLIVHAYGVVVLLDQIHTEFLRARI